MKFKTVHITDHAFERWEERIGKIDKNKILDSIRTARVIKSNEVLPFATTRKKGTTYCYCEELKTLFYLENVTIDEYRLVTLISENSSITRFVQESIDFKNNIANVPTTPIEVEKRIDEEDINVYNDELFKSLDYVDNDYISSQNKNNLKKLKIKLSIFQRIYESKISEVKNNLRNLNQNFQISKEYIDLRSKILFCQNNLLNIKKFLGNY